MLIKVQAKRFNWSLVINLNLVLVAPLPKSYSLGIRIISTDGFLILTGYGSTHSKSGKKGELIISLFVFTNVILLCCFGDNYNFEVNASAFILLHSYLSCPVISVPTIWRHAFCRIDDYSWFDIQIWKCLPWCFRLNQVCCLTSIWVWLNEWKSSHSTENMIFFMSFDGICQFSFTLQMHQNLRLCFMFGAMSSCPKIFMFSKPTAYQSGSVSMHLPALAVFVTLPFVLWFIYLWCCVECFLLNHWINV